MVRKSVIALLFVCCAGLALAQPPRSFDKSWERLCGVLTASDEVRSFALYPAGNLFVTINRNAPADALKIFNAQSGLRAVKDESVPMSGSVYTVPTALYSVMDGDFTDDGKLVVCSLSYAVNTQLRVYMWDTLTTGPRLIYTSAALPNQWLGYRMGDAIDVVGSTADNSASILISGNNAASIPLKLTTADNGRNWSAVSLAGPVRAMEIQQLPDYTFYAVYPGLGWIQKYSAAGVALTALPPDRIVVPAATGGFVVDVAANTVYAMGYGANSTLKVYDLAAGTLLYTATDGIDIGGLPGGTLNGSAGVELLVTPGGGRNVFALAERNGMARYVYSATVNVPGDYASVQGAIAAFTVGGPLDLTTTWTLPLQIKVTGTFDEAITLNDANVGAGNISGDLLLKKGDTVTTYSVIKLQTYPGTPDDGIQVHQNVMGVAFKGLVFCPSLTTPITDDMIKVDENSANTTMNWFESWDVIYTNITTAGDPMVLSKAAALVGPPPASGSPMASGDQLFKHWNDPGESLSAVFDNSVWYGGPSYAMATIMGGIAGEQSFINDSLCAWNEYAAFEIGVYSGANGSPDYCRITGTDAKAGPLNCTAAIQNEWHGIYGYTSAGTPASSNGYVAIDNYLCYVDSLGDNAAGANADTRGYSGSARWSMQMRDSIIKCRNACIVDGVINPPSFPAIWERCTFVQNLDNANNTIFAVGTVAGLPADWVYSPVLVKDCIMGGPGAKFSGTLTGGVIVQNSAFIQDGPYAIGSKGTVTTETLTIRYDAVFANDTDPTNANLFDVKSQLYAGKASAGNLAGGANYIGDVFPEIDVAPLAYDFGSLTAGSGPTTTTITIQNLGTGQDLYLYSNAITGSADFTVVTPPTSPVAPAGSATAIVQYTPNLSGLQTATLAIDANDASEATTNVSLQGTATPPTRVEDWRVY